MLAIHQALEPGVQLEDWYGSNRPLQGWYSERYGKRVANHALEYKTSGHDALYATLITSGERAAEPAAIRLEHGAPGEDLELVVESGADRWRVEMNRLARDGEAVRVTRETGS